MRRALRLAAIGLVVAAVPAAAQAGAVAGRVTDQATGNPLVGARVQVIGTALTGQTNADGRYRFSNVPVGQATVRVVALGYAAQNKVTDVRADAAATVDFALSLTPFSLDEFVVTATGEQSRKEIGNAISTVDVENLVKTAPIANMNDLLVAKAPGVQVLPSPMTGGGARVRIRGNSSLSLSNNPIYVVDGVRVVSDVNSSSIGIGGTNPSRVNDLNPEDIESIDVVKGPSASTLYGTDAANGVIVIKTKRGRAGKPVWNSYVEQGFIKDYNQYPIAYRGWRAGSTVSNTTQCLLSQVVAGSCAQDSVSSFNLFEDKDASPNGTGRRQQYGLQVSGGSDVAKYYLSGEWEDEIGQLQMPAFARDRLLAQRNITELPGEQDRPNALRKTNLRANISSNLGEKIDVGISSGFVSSTQRLPQTDNNTTGLLSNGYGGPGFKGNLVVPASGVPARANYGYRLYTPDEFFSETVTQDINRTILSGTSNYRPTSWLSARGVLGMDFVSREDSDICRRDECTFFGTSKTGFKTDNRTTFFTYTGDVSATANYSLDTFIGDLKGRTTVGGQYVKERFARNGAASEDLPPGATTVTAGAIPSADESTTQSSTVGFFVEQYLAYKDKLFITGAVRSDRNSAFGEQFKRVYYPKVAVSYVLSDEGFFKSSFINNLRLRGAYGASGRQPGPNDAFRYFTPGTANFDQADVPAITFTELGNPLLKPERTAETELGFDLSMANSRINLEFTYFGKNSSDALIQVPVAPSVGASANQWANIGKVNNKGFEVAINATPIDNRSFGWEVIFAGSYTKNKITAINQTQVLSSTNQHRLDYPINGWWAIPYTYSDANGDGIIALSELTGATASDTAVYIGPSLPPYELTVFNSVEMFDRKFRIQANVDAKLGGYQLNGTERIRCESRLNCRGDIDPTAPLWEQARAVAVRQSGSRTQYGYIEKTNFLRFREVSATYTMPESWARLVRASRATITASARNLGVITNYSGIDPEAGYFSTVLGTQSDFQTAPPPTYWTFRVNLTF